MNDELIFADVDKFMDHCSELNTAPGKMVNMKCVGFATILIIISLLYEPGPTRGPQHDLKLLKLKYSCNSNEIYC